MRVGRSGELPALARELIGSEDIRIAVQGIDQELQDLYREVFVARAISCVCVCVCVCVSECACLAVLSLLCFQTTKHGTRAFIPSEGTHRSVWSGRARLCGPRKVGNRPRHAKAILERYGRLSRMGRVWCGLI